MNNLPEASQQKTKKTYVVSLRQNPMSISTPLLITSVVFSIAGFPSCFSANQQFEECLSPPLRCGSGPSVFPNITYPFWGNNIGKPNFCGQTEFELSCKENQSLTLEIENLTLRVISANIIIFSARTDNRTITVADESLFEGGCPKILNFKGDDKFSLNPTTETIDLFLCSSGNPVESSLSTLTCQESNKNMTTYHVFGSSNPAQNCDKIGEIPMLGSAKNALHQSNESNQALKMALEKGFELKYKIENQICRDCALSSGICGSDSGSGDFRCLCADKIDNSSCYTIHGQDIGDAFGNNHGILSRVLIIGVCVVSAISMSIVVMGSLNATERSPDQLSRCITRSPGQQPELKAFNQLKQYSYAQVTIITRSFAEVVGRGGFGTVYRGTFSDGRMVAVKVLKDSMGDGEDFINEIESMSETSHVNIVTLLGFCSEGTNKAIIYEFLENGSLDQFISSNTPMNTDWTALYGIALGVARGLEYLHHGCRTRIVHFDIKPQNVLLDDNLCPKVSDFGLAKLCERKSILSLLGTRGTIGYIAPKLFSRMYGRDSHKSDVYSYGMMVLEMIGARNKKRAAQNSASNASSMYFPEWIYKDLEKGDSARLNEDTITCEEEEIARKMTLVGLWCIQPSPSDRPPMNRVVEMMEGSVDALEVPPRPVFQIPTATFQESSTFSEDISVCTEYDP